MESRIQHPESVYSRLLPPAPCILTHPDRFGISGRPDEAVVNIRIYCHIGGSCD